MCARFTVLRDTPVASAISGCVIPLSRSNTIWIRCRVFAFFSRLSARCNRLTWSALHLTISAPAPNQMVSTESHFECRVDYHFAPETNSSLSIQVALEVVSAQSTGGPGHCLVDPGKTHQRPFHVVLRVGRLRSSELLQ